MSRATMPDEALDWLAVWPSVRGLTIGDDVHLPRRLRDRGHTLIALTEDHRQARRLWGPTVRSLVGNASALPFDPFQFEVVFVHQGLHLLDLDAALPQITRVLMAGGCLSASYVIRDDSVPWVRRLQALLRRYDPLAMSGDYGHASLERLRETKYFADIDQRAFRIWRTVTREQMAQLVRGQSFAAKLDQGQLDRLVGAVMEFYDSSARPGESLRLPFQLLCWRAWVDHAELTGPVHVPDGGLNIPV